jgi:DNA-binding GntR family transcriptional regulator
MTPAPPHHSTKAEFATEALRARIRSGELKPGAPLRIDVLTRELGMSSTPVREALRLLQADRLVEYHPHRGTNVASAGADPTMEEVYRIRMHLEPFATEIAVGLMGDKDIARLEHAHQALVKASNTRRVSRQRITQHNVTWHWIIYEAAGMPILVELIQRLWDAFPWRTLWVIPDTAATSTDDHERIMEAIRDRDANEAAERMRAHIGRGYKYLIAERDGVLAGGDGDAAPASL